MATTACGSQIDPKSAVHKTEFNEVTYYFCGKGCKTLFDENPAAFTGPAHGEATEDRQPHCCPHCCEH